VPPHMDDPVTAHSSAAHRGGGASIGICVTGKQRTLLSFPVLGQFQSLLLQPLRAAALSANDVGLHMVLIGNEFSKPDHAASVRHLVETHYAPDSLDLLPERPLHLRCNRSLELGTRHCVPRPRWPCGNRALAVLVQWVGVRQCYRQAARREDSRGRRYHWLLRWRTDIVLMRPLPPLQSLGADQVFVPQGGMSSNPQSACMNDHIFLCPRHLCHAYFELAELWDSPYCVDQAEQGPTLPTRPPTDRDRGETAARGEVSADDTASIFATRGGNGILRPQVAAPRGPFVVPRLPYEAIDAEWFFFARYKEAPALIEAPNGSALATCGLIRELKIHYALCRSSRITCKEQLVTWWRGWSEAGGAQTDATNIEALKECEVLNGRFLEAKRKGGSMGG
jgi:hypothetical protein